MKKKPFRTVLALILVVSLFPALLLMTNHIPGVAAAQNAVSTVGKNPANLADAFQISKVTTEAELNEAIQASLGKTTVILGADYSINANADNRTRKGNHPDR